MAEAASDQTRTPTSEGPAADAGLLATGSGASARAQAEAGIGLTLETLQLYGQELVAEANELRNRGGQIAESAPRLSQETIEQIRPQAQNLAEILVSTAPAEVPLRASVEVFSYGAILLGLASLGSLAGAYLLSPFLSLVLPRFGAGLLALAGIPALGYYRIGLRGSESALRIDLAALAIGQGALVGYAISHSYLYATPLSFLTAGVVSAVLPFVANGGRINTLSASLGAALAANFLVGALTGSLSTAYLTLSVLYAAAAGAIIQLLASEPGSAQPAAYQLALTSVTLGAKLLVFSAFGYSHASA